MQELELEHDPLLASSVHPADEVHLDGLGEETTPAVLKNFFMRE